VVLVLPVVSGSLAAFLPKDQLAIQQLALLPSLLRPTYSALASMLLVEAVAVVAVPTALTSMECAAAADSTQEGVAVAVLVAQA
jgi:hypothetical protein